MSKNSPDYNSCGFLDRAPDPIRYDGASDNPDDAAYKIAMQVPRGGRVLDVGCGTGVVSAIIKKFSDCELIGIEPDAERVVVARQRGLNVTEGYLTADRSASLGKFDAIVFADVLEHLPNPGAMILTAKELLVEGGCIIASVPNIAHWSVRTDLATGRFNYEDCGIMDATHLRWYTHSSLRRFFERLDFEVASVSETMMPFLSVYSIRRPWRWIPIERKKSILRFLINWNPELFGCQIVIKAKAKPSAK